MEQSLEIQSIIKQIENLDDAGKINVLENVVSMIKEKLPDDAKFPNLMGMGGDLWRKGQMEEYTKELKNTWEEILDKKNWSKL